MSRSNTELEIELFHESTMLRQNEEDLKVVLNDSQALIKELIKDNPTPDAIDWAEWHLRDISKIKRKVSFRKTIFHRRYPNA